MSSWRWFSATARPYGGETPVGPGNRAGCQQVTFCRPIELRNGTIHSTGPVAVYESRTGLGFRAFAALSNPSHSPCHPRTPVQVGATALSCGGLVSRTGKQFRACCSRRTDLGFRGGPFFGCPRPSRSLTSALSSPPGRLELGASGPPYRPHPQADRTGGSGFGGLSITSGCSSRRSRKPFGGYESSASATAAAEPRVRRWGHQRDGLVASRTIRALSLMSGLFGWSLVRWIAETE